MMMYKVKENLSRLRGVVDKFSNLAIIADFHDHFSLP
jgi:hypothetical protein